MIYYGSELRTKGPTGGLRMKRTTMLRSKLLLKKSKKSFWKEKRKNLSFKKSIVYLID